MFQGDRAAGLQRGEQPRAVPAGGQGGARQHHLPALQQVSSSAANRLIGEVVQYGEGPYWTRRPLRHY